MKTYTVWVRESAVKAVTVSADTLAQAVKLVGAGEGEAGDASLVKITPYRSEAEALNISKKELAERRKTD